MPIYSNVERMNFYFAVSYRKKLISVIEEKESIENEYLFYFFKVIREKRRG